MSDRRLVVRIEARHPGAARSLGLLAACLLLSACGTDTSEPTVATGPVVPVSADPRPVDKVAPRSTQETAFVAAPFGLLRVAPAANAGPGGLHFGHGRGGAHADLVLSTGPVSRPGHSEVSAAARAVADSGSEPARLSAPSRSDGPRWTSTPGRLVGLLEDEGLIGEATTSGRVAFYRFTATAGEPMVLTFHWQGGASGELNPARGRRAITGVLNNTDRMALHAAIRFDQAFRVLETASSQGQLALVFQPPDGVVQVRVALSTVDLAAARDNLLELDHWNFERAQDGLLDQWDPWLRRLTVEGEGPGTEQLRNAWFRVLAHYGDLTDRNGRFRAADGSVRRVPGGRILVGNLDVANEAATVIPLLALLAPEEAVGIADTLLLHHRVTGRFPVKSGWGFEQASEAGPAATVVPALSVLAGLAGRDLPDLEAQRVLPAMLKTTGPLGEGRDGLGLGGLGFFAYDQGSGPTVTLTLEESAAQHALAVVAAQLGNRPMAAEAAVRGVLYRQLFDAESGFFRARSSRMDWRSPFNANEPSSAVRSDYRDGSPWNALWLPARFDIEGLLTLLGGRQELALRLDEFLAGRADATPTRAAVLDPVPWLFAFSNRPRDGQPFIDRRLRALANSRADTVTAAAWQIFARLGLFPVSVASGEYVLSRPTIPRSVLRVAEGQLVIEADPARSGTIPATLDEVPLTGPTVSHRRLAAGGVLMASGSE